ncbi:hypothetical protein AAHB54_30980 [Bacillus cereus]
MKKNVTKELYLIYFLSYKDKFNTVNLVSAKNRDGEMIREYLNSRVPLEELIERKTQLEKAMNKECFRNIKIEWKKLSEIKNGNKRGEYFQNGTIYFKVLKILESLLKYITWNQYIIFCIVIILNKCIQQMHFSKLMKWKVE